MKGGPWITSLKGSFLKWREISSVICVIIFSSERLLTFRLIIFAITAKSGKKQFIMKFSYIPLKFALSALPFWNVCLGNSHAEMWPWAAGKDGTALFWVLLVSMNVRKGLKGLFWKSILFCCYWHRNWVGMESRNFKHKFMW